MSRTISVDVDIDEFYTETLIDELCDRAGNGDEDAMRFVSMGAKKRTDNFVSTAAIAGLFRPSPNKQELQELMSVPAIGFRAQNLWRKSKTESPSSPGGGSALEAAAGAPPPAREPEGGK